MTPICDGGRDGRRCLSPTRPSNRLCIGPEARFEPLLRPPRPVGRTGWRLSVAADRICCCARQARRASAIRHQLALAQSPASRAQNRRRRSCSSQVRSPLSMHKLTRFRFPVHPLRSARRLFGSAACLLLLAAPDSPLSWPPEPSSPRSAVGRTGMLGTPGPVLFWPVFPTGDCTHMASSTDSRANPGGHLCRFALGISLGTIRTAASIVRACQGASWSEMAWCVSVPAHILSARPPANYYCTGQVLQASLPRGLGLIIGKSFMDDWHSNSLQWKVTSEPDIRTQCFGHLVCTEEYP